MNIYRHGDLLIRQVDSLPKVKSLKTNILAEGEFTGHKHALLTMEREPIDILSDGNMAYISIKDKAMITHQEHRTIEIEPGDYVIVHEREFDPFSEKIRQVRD